MAKLLPSSFFWLVHESGMIDGMTTRRISLTLPEDLLAAAKRAVAAGQAPSVSAYIADVAEVGATRDLFDRAPAKPSRQIDEWLAEVMRGTHTAV